MNYWRRLSRFCYALFVDGVPQHFRNYRSMRDYCTKYRIEAKEQA